MTRNKYNAKDEESKTFRANGFGLNDRQQRAIRDLWEWQKDSLNANIVLGGPLVEPQE